MKRNRDTIRNPNNWKEDSEEEPQNPWAGFSIDESGGYHNEYEVDDIEEIERRNYFSLVEQIKAREEVLESNEQYYKGYEEWYNDAERRVEVLEIPREIMIRHPILSELPKGVCVMGGMARSIAREVITGDAEPIRDIDLVNILDENGESLVDHETLDYLARRYMMDDYIFGHGINSEKLNDYFETRDFTINQCLIRNGKLLITRQAYNDFQENIIRPTEYELPDRERRLSSRLFMKALMMKVVIGEISAPIPLLEDVEVDVERLYPFDIALTLNKMMSRGVKIAQTFTEELVEWGIIPEEYSGRPMHAASMLLDYVYDFSFRPTKFDEMDDEQQREYHSERALRSYYSRDTVIRDIISEYTELSQRDFEDPSYSYDSDGERISGSYTISDYLWINGVDQ